MAETVRGSASFVEPPETVAGVLLDVSAYPSWNDGMRDATVLTRDDADRPLTATFTIDIKLTELSYTLAYLYDNDTVSWSLVDGDLLSQFDGQYTITQQDDMTQVDYSITVDVTIALPKVMKRRAADTMLNQTLAGLTTQLTVATGT